MTFVKDGFADTITKYDGATLFQVKYGVRVAMPLANGTGG